MLDKDLNEENCISSLWKYTSNKDKQENISDRSSQGKFIPEYYDNCYSGNYDFKENKKIAQQCVKILPNDKYSNNFDKISKLIIPIKSFLQGSNNLSMNLNDNTNYFKTNESQNLLPYDEFQGNNLGRFGLNA